MSDSDQESPRSARTVQEFLQYLWELDGAESEMWYRGHASNLWNLTASIFRSPARLNNEVILLKRFMQEAKRHHDEVPSDRWDWLFFAQHHQVPTRLLDWSEQPLVALFFAAQDSFDIQGDPKTARDGKVWFLRPLALNQENGFDFAGRDLPLFGMDEVLEKYFPHEGTLHRQSPIAALATRSFRRISAQWGTFTICNVDRALDLEPSSEKFVTGIDIPAEAKPEIRTQLKRLGLEDRTLYLDLFRLGARLSEVYG